MIQTNIYKTNRLTDLENKLMVTRGKGRGRELMEEEHTEGIVFKVGVL